MREPDVRSAQLPTGEGAAAGSEEAQSASQGSGGFSSAGPLPPVQRKVASGAAASPPPTASDLAFEGGGGGSALPDPVRGKMEQSFGADFSGVRVHQGGKADALGSHALAQGDNLHFANGQYDPSSRRGQELIGHELAHDVQQRAGRVDKAQHDGPVVADASLEREADQQGAAAARGDVVATQPAAPAITGGAPAKDTAAGSPALADAHALAMHGISAMSGTPGLVVSHPPADLATGGAQASGGAAEPRVVPEAGVVGSLQLEYDMCTGKLALIGWVWAGAGAIIHTPIGEQWYGAYTFVEGTICETKLDFMPKLPHGEPPPKDENKEKGPDVGWGIAGFPMLITPGKMNKFKAGGLEMGLLVTPDSSDWGADIELVALLDVLGYLGPVAAGAKKVIEVANTYASKFGLNVEAEAGLVASANVHGWKGPKGLVVDDAKVAGGGFVAVGVDLPRSKSALPKAH